MKQPKQLALADILDFYDVHLRESEDHKIRQALGMDLKVYKRRLSNYPQLREAKLIAESRRGSRESFSGYIFQRLSPEAKSTWDEIKFWDDRGSNYEQIEKILRGKTKQLKQELFIHALVTSNFDLSTACHMVGVTANQLHHWKQDLEFRQLIEEIQWHKKNFFERALIDLVEARHPSATIFVNRTINKDRGYGEEVQVNHTGTLGGMSIEDLDLPIEVRLQILDALKRKQELQNAKPILEIENIQTLPSVA